MAFSAQLALGEEDRQRPRLATFPGQPKMGGVVPSGGWLGPGEGGTGRSVGTHQPAGLVMTFSLPGKHANHVPGPEITLPPGLRKLISLVGRVYPLPGQVRLWELHPPPLPEKVPPRPQAAVS